MLDKLKQMTGNAMIQKGITQITPVIDHYLEKIKTFSPEQIRDDVFFDTHISTPAWADVSAKLGGFVGLLPALPEKFPAIMRYLRDELVVIHDNNISLAEDVHARIPQLVLDGIQSIRKIHVLI